MSQTSWMQAEEAVSVHNSVLNSVRLVYIISTMRDLSREKNKKREIVNIIKKNIYIYIYCLVVTSLVVQW